MKKSDYPLWLRIAMRLPLRLKHRIRVAACMAEFWSTKLVLDDDASLCLLIENRAEPDFAEFDRRLDEARKQWGIHDAWLEGLAVRRRLLSFQREYKQKKEDKHE